MTTKSTTASQLFSVCVQWWVFAFFFQGNYFLFIELASQFYRTLLPIPVWIYYLLDNTEKIPSKILGVMLTAAYMVFKGKSIMTQFVACKSAAAKLLQSTVRHFQIIFKHCEGLSKWRAQMTKRFHSYHKLFAVAIFFVIELHTKRVEHVSFHPIFGYRDMEIFQALRTWNPRVEPALFVMIIWKNPQSYIVSTFFARNVWRLGLTARRLVQCAELR